MCADQIRVIKQSCIDEWQTQMQAHQSERWHPNRTSLDEVKNTQLFQIARRMVHRFSLGQAIESGQHDLETIGPRWWDKDYPQRDWLSQMSSLSVETLPQVYGPGWWRVFSDGVTPCKKRGVPIWQHTEFTRQMTMLRYSCEHIFGGSEAAYTVCDIETALNHKLDQFAFTLTDTRHGYDWGFAGPWDYWHFAQCLKANLSGKPYIYKCM
jgi:hypothetical protein